LPKRKNIHLDTSVFLGRLNAEPKSLYTMRRLDDKLLLTIFTFLFVLAFTTHAQPPANSVTAVKAGRLLDPETGTILTNQIILIEHGKFKAIGANLAIPKDAKIIDLSALTVMPGLVDAHNHLALTYKVVPERNVYYVTYINESTALRAIQAASNGMQMLSSGFTIVRDMGNNGNYADTALRQAIEQGWIPGPKIINSGIIIGGMGGQFWPTPEMGIGKNIVSPEYLDADTPDEIIKAVHQNLLYGAKVIKLCVDCKPWGYSVDDIKLAMAEAAKAGMKVEGHVQTLDGAKRAIEAGIWSIAHDSGLNDEMHKLMAKKGIWRAGTETPITLPEHTTEERYNKTVASLRNAYDNKVPLTFSTDADYYVPGKTRGEVAIEFIETWKAAKIPNADILRAMTVNGYKVSETEQTRGFIKVGLAADLIAVSGNPLEKIDALREVNFVMKDGEVFKQNGVMTPEKFLHGGPVNGYNIR
jgi:imidazolonepropionase-like amidohydrolase